MSIHDPFEPNDMDSFRKRDYCKRGDRNCDKIGCDCFTELPKASLKRLERDFPQQLWCMTPGTRVEVLKHFDHRDKIINDYAADLEKITEAYNDLAAEVRELLTLDGDGLFGCDGYMNFSYYPAINKAFKEGGYL